MGLFARGMRLSSAHFGGTAPKPARTRVFPAASRASKRYRTPSVCPPRARSLLDIRAAVRVRFPGQGDRPVMAVTTGFQGRRFDVPEARTGVPRIDPPSPAPCAAADAVFNEAKAGPLLQRSPADERERTRTGTAPAGPEVGTQAPARTSRPTQPGTMRPRVFRPRKTSGVECSARREHDSHAETTSGTMQVVGLGCARRGHDGLHPLDAALNLLPERSLVDMRRHVTIETASRVPPRTPWKTRSGTRHYPRGSGDAACGARRQLQ